MESLASFLVFTAIVTCLLGKPRLCASFFCASLFLVVWLFHAHSTDMLPLNF